MEGLAMDSRRKEKKGIKSLVGEADSPRAGH